MISVFTWMGCFPQEEYEWLPVYQQTDKAKPGLKITDQVSGQEMGCFFARGHPL